MLRIAQSLVRVSYAIRLVSAVSINLPGDPEGWRRAGGWEESHRSLEHKLHCELNLALVTEGAKLVRGQRGRGGVAHSGS